ncbi:MAG: right-handed parallel beta-helix repeat-containing protein, partial [Bacteroidetes bacterium]|nr:right-handed parallel beta-helix repeat-containing protein [Bacteroidota bacterium]
MRRKFYSLKASVCFVAFILGISSVKAQTVNIYASTTGSATGAGTSAGAPVTISRARAIAKANPTHPCTIWLASGIYYRLTLDATDSRSASAPVTYQSMVKGGAIFQPTMTLPTSSFSAIPASIQSRIIDPTAKTHVKQISLTSFNLPDMNAWGRSFSQVNMHIPAFFYNGAALPMSRWPADTSWMKMGDIISKGSAGSSPGGIFKYRDGRARYWVNAISDGGVYLCGNWQVPWTMDVILTKAINTTDSTITQDIGISGGIGSQSWREPRGQEEYCAINLVEEIRAEGQWAINTKTKMLYMWVPASGNVQMSGDWTMAAITATGVNYTNFVGLAVRGGSGNGINLTGCNNVLIAGADISYVGRNAVAITDGRNCTVQSSDLHNLGAGGVIIKSSDFLLDQAKVNKSNHQVINNHIYTYAQQVPLYSAAVNVYDAVGTYVAYNKVHDCPHVGIMYGGNSNRLEYNEVYDVVKRYSDMGCFYTWSDVNVWNRRGNVINHNLVHDAPLAHGLYGDNYASGDSNTYNIVTGVSMALFDHYGYFNSYTNNIVYNSTYPVTTMTEATSNSSYSTHYSSLQSLWTANAAYQGAYPECNDMVGTSGRNNAYTSKIWPLVQGNVFFNNP